MQAVGARVVGALVVGDAVDGTCVIGALVIGDAVDGTSVVGSRVGSAVPVVVRTAFVSLEMVTVVALAIEIAEASVVVVQVPEHPSE